MEQVTEFVIGQAQAEAVEQGNEIAVPRLGGAQRQVSRNGQDDDAVQVVMDMEPRHDMQKEVRLPVADKSGGGEGNQKGDRNREENVEVDILRVVSDLFAHRFLPGEAAEDTD